MNQRSTTITREGLYEQVWATPMTTLARGYGVSDVALAKTCRKLGVPLPPRGHWAKLQHGKKVPPQPPLPKAGKDGFKTAIVTRTLPSPLPEPPDPVLDEAVRSLGADEGPDQGRRSAPQPASGRQGASASSPRHGAEKRTGSPDGAYASNER